MGDTVKEPDSHVASDFDRDLQKAQVRARNRLLYLLHLTAT